MRVRALAVVALAAVAFVALYAISQAGEDDGDAAVAPAAIETETNERAAPPELEPAGALPGLKTRRQPPGPAGPGPAVVAPAPAPAGPPPDPPAPTSAPAPEPAPAPAPAPPPDPGEPFYDDG
jgi:hypothetical protein